ncbi:MAG: hypothetical protein KF799_07955 [Bdellovibrionales bacterium]|nr:hypothetical protein [Bdellovibrionales bacterium]
MRSKFSESKIIAGLIGLLAIEAALLLLHLGIFTFDGMRTTSGEAVAGQIVKSHNQLRRRGINSLVWEKSTNDEVVYFHDSILTLAQSTATLRIQQTEISLSENTLVTIEPQHEREHGEIRLKFVKGNLQARNPYQATRIDGEAWTVDVHQGSEVEFRQVGEGDYELQVKKGEATFKSDNGESTVKSSELLRIDAENAKKMEMDKELVWETAPAERVYAHSDKVEVPLHWKGKAEQLVVQSLGQPEVAMPVPEGKLELPVGQHRLYLREEGRTSPALNVQVWRAPVIHLLRPLPRNRAAVGEKVEFVWMQIPGVQEFRLVTKGGSHPLDVKVKGNVTSATFAEPQDLEWSIYGRDAEGFDIPPLYSNPLFIRENPLAAPKLKSPSLRKPAQSLDGASYWWRLDHWLLPQAYAAESSENVATFAWEPVEGADQYTIEISETADFRQPLVIRTLSKAQFMWRGFAAKVYYWRVAGGTKSGRLGVFSEPAEVDFQAMVDGQEVDGVSLRQVKKEKSSEETSAKAAKSTAELQAKETQITVEKAIVERAVVVPEKPPEFGHFVGWSPRYISAVLNAKEKVKSKLSGGTLAALTVESPIVIDEQRLWKVDLSYAQAKFKPNPPEDYLYQKDLSWQDLRGSALYFKSRWGYGFVMQQSLLVKREGDETIQGVSSFGGGPSVAAMLRGGRWLYNGSFSVLASQSGVGVQSAHSMRWNIYRGFSVGGGVQGELTSTSPMSFVGSAFGLAGFEF